MKTYFNHINQNRFIKPQYSKKEANINFGASRIVLKTPKINDINTQQFFDKLVYYWHKFPTDCKSKKPVMFNYSGGVAAFLVDKTTKDETKFLIKDQVTPEVDWNKQDSSFFDMEITINKNGQMTQGNILTEKNRYNFRAFFERNARSRRLIQYDYIDYLPSKEENKIWRARGSSGILLTLPQGKGLQLSDLFLELSGAATSFVSKAMLI